MIAHLTGAQVVKRLRVNFPSFVLLIKGGALTPLTASHRPARIEPYLELYERLSERMAIGEIPPDNEDWQKLQELMLKAWWFDLDQVEDFENEYGLTPKPPPLKPGDPNPATLGSLTGALLETHHHTARTSPHLEKSFHNDPALFPDLNLGALVKHAHGLAKRHPFIQKITLYQGNSWHCQDSFTPPYVLAVEVPVDERKSSWMRLQKENPQAVTEIREAYRKLRKIELEKEEAWKKYWENPKKAKRKPPAERETRQFRDVLLADPKSKLSEAARKILQMNKEISDSTWEEAVNLFQPESLRSLVGDAFCEVVKPEHRVWLEKNNRSFWDEWIIYRCSPGEEPAEVSKYHWLLYKKEDEIESHKLREVSFGVDGVQKVLNQGLDETSETSTKGVEILGHAQQMNGALSSRPDKDMIPDKSTSPVVCFYQKNNRWFIGALGSEIQFMKKHMGFAYLHELLSNPNKTFEPETLYNLSRYPRVDVGRASMYSSMTQQQLAGEKLYIDGAFTRQVDREDKQGAHLFSFHPERHNFPILIQK